MFKPVNFLVHQTAGPPWSTGRLFEYVFRRGRDFIEGVARGPARCRVEPKSLEVVPKQIAPVAGVPGTLQKTARTCRNILYNYLSKQQTESLAARMRDRYGFQMVRGSCRFYESFGHVGKKLGMQAFVGIGLAAGSQWKLGNEDDDLVGLDGICKEIRAMFVKKRTDDEFIGQDFEVQLDHHGRNILEDLELGKVIATGYQTVAFAAKMKIIEQHKDVDETDETTGAQVTDNVVSKDEVVSDDLILTIHANEGNAAAAEAVVVEDANDVTLENVLDEVVMLMDEQQANLVELCKTVNEQSVQLHALLALQQVHSVPEEVDEEWCVVDHAETDDAGRMREFCVMYRAESFPFDPGEGQLECEMDIDMESELGQEQCRIVDMYDGVFVRNLELRGLLQQLASLDTQSADVDSDALEQSLEELAESVLNQQLQLAELYQAVCQQHVKLKNMLADVVSQNLTTEKQGNILKSDITVQLDHSDDGTSSHTLESDSDYRVDNANDCMEDFQPLDGAHDEAYALTLKVRVMEDEPLGNIEKVLIKELRCAPNAALNGRFTNINGYMLHRRPHFNVAKVYGGFVSTLHELQSVCFDLQLHSDWLARQLPTSPALCIVAKRYTCTLEDYLQSHKPATLPLPDSALLVGQLLEAVVHLNSCGIVHRDLTSRNIEVDVLPSGPHLVVTNFSHSLQTHGVFSLRLPYFTEETCRGGNSQLMAPEIATARLFSFLNYTKSDLWACGAISYEIFGAENPFYRTDNGNRLWSSTYQDQDLPSLPANVLHSFDVLVKLMLTRDPCRRPDATLIANAIHVLLWSPQQWIIDLESGGATSQPTTLDVQRWLVQQTATNMCYAAVVNSSQDRRWIAMNLRRMFFERVNASQIMQAFNLLWLHGTVDFD